MTAEATHTNPVWRDRADFIIGATLEEPGMTEQLWARQIGAYEFEICCIPFFAYDIALGDTVETDPEYNVTRVLEHSGRFVFRVWLESTTITDELVSQLVALGALVEWSSTHLLAIDAKDEEHAQIIANVLEEQERVGHLRYETGRL